MVDVAVRLVIVVVCIMSIAWGAVLCQENNSWGALLLVPSTMVVCLFFAAAELPRR